MASEGATGNSCQVHTAARGRDGGEAAGEGARRGHLGPCIALWEDEAAWMANKGARSCHLRPCEAEAAPKSPEL